MSVTESSNRSKKSHGKGKTPKFDIEAALAGANTAANGSSNTFLTEVDEEIKHMSADEFIYQQEIQQQQLQEQKAQVKRNSKESQMKAYHHMLERIAKMKSIWNKLDIIHRDKVRTLTNFENQVIEIPSGLCIRLRLPPHDMVVCRSICVTNQMHS